MKPEIYLTARNYIKAIPKKDGAVSQEIYSEAIEALAPVLKNMNDGVLIGRMQFDYHITPKPNHHLMFTAGILEDFFQGAGAEYLYFVPNKNYAFGAASLIPNPAN